MKIIKLHSKQSCTIKTDSCPQIPVQETEIHIPRHHYGEFYIRERFGRKGIDAPNCVFHENWTGTPNVTLIHKGANDEVILEGEEIGELHIRYSPPSPLSGTIIELPSTFAFRKVNDQMQVVTVDGKLYNCGNIYEILNNEGMRQVNDTKEEWEIIETGAFIPVFIMSDYTLVRVMDILESITLFNTFISQRLTQSFTTVEKIFKDDPPMREMVQKHIHDFTDTSIGETAAVTETPVKSFTLSDSFKISRTDDNHLVASLNHVPIFKFDNYSYLFGSEQYGFGHDVEDFSQYKSGITIKELLQDGCQKDKDLSFSIQQPELINFEESIILPPHDLIKICGPIAALILINLDKITSRKFQSSKFNIYRKFILKAVNVVLYRNWNALGNKFGIKSIWAKCIEWELCNNHFDLDPANFVNDSDFDYYGDLIKQLKSNNQNSKKPVELFDFLANNFTWGFVTVVFGEKLPEPCDPA